MSAEVLEEKNLKSIQERALKDNTNDRYVATVSTFPNNFPEFPELERMYDGWLDLALSIDLETTRVNKKEEQ